MMNFNKNNVNDMKSYLGYALEFEKYVYLWENSINKANNEIRQLTNEKIKLQEQKNRSATASSTIFSRAQDSAQSYDKEAKTIKSKLSFFTKVFITILFVFCFLPAIVIVASGKTNLLIAIVAIAIYSLPLIPLYIGIRNYYKNKYKEIIANKNNNASIEHIEYEKKKAALSYQDADKKLSILSQKEPALNAQAMEISKNYREAKTTLNNIYALNIIPVKYRNLVAIATFYEYLDTGRCTTIQGHGGIYDTYEFELQNNIIISNLQSINASLSRIEANQQFLYSELQQTNRTLSSINSSLVSIDKTNQEIAKNTAISAVANKQTAEATRYLAWRAWANGY